MTSVAHSHPPFLPRSAVAIAVVGLAAFNSFADPTPSLPQTSKLDFESDFMIGPIPGLTTGWHVAPTETAIIANVSVQFWARADLAAAVAWSGATEVRRDENGSTAECSLSSLERLAIDCEVRQGDELMEYRSILDVSDIPVDEIGATPIVARVFPFDVRDYTEEELEDLPEELLEGQTAQAYWNGSIAGLYEVAPDRYVTSIERELELVAATDSPEFTSLLEWRIDGKPQRLGDTLLQTFEDRSWHTVSVGPPAHAQQIDIGTYEVVVTGHTPEGEIVDGVPVTFTAEVRPAGLGLEDEILWISYTKFGNARPILGRGPEFTVRFDDTIVYSPYNDKPYQKIGVRADNGITYQGSCPGDCVPPEIPGDPVASGEPTTGSEPYTVTGGSCQEVSDDVFDGREYPGTTTAGFSFDAGVTTASAQGSDEKYCCRAKLMSVEAIMEIVVSMPSWDPPLGTPPEDIDAWNLFMTNLATHEQGHVDIFTNEFDAFKQALLGAEGEHFGAGATAEDACAEATEKIYDALDGVAEAEAARVGALQDAYDDTTRHGETQGAVLNCP